MPLYFLIGLLLGRATLAPAQPGSLDYHDFKQINQVMDRLAEQHEHAVDFTLGYSQMGRPIRYLSIGKSQNPDTPVIYINGTHHGDEKASTEASLGIMSYLAENHDNIVVDRLLRRFQFLVQPLVNPDGHAIHSRFCASGIDPNRDYPSPQGSRKSFQIPETRLVSQLLSKHKVYASAALHSGIEAVLWPWASSKGQSPHHQTFFSLGQVLASAMGIQSFQQSYHDYQTSGEFIDYAYKKHGTLAFTIEVSRSNTPSKEALQRVIKRSIEGTIAFASALERELDSH